MIIIYLLYYLEQFLCLVKLANRGQPGPSKCAAGSLDNRFFLSTLLVNSNQSPCVGHYQASCAALALALLA